MIDTTMLLEITNILVTIYAIVYAFRFLYLTKADEARKPWNYLTYGVVALLALQISVFFKSDVSPLIKQLLTLLLTTLLLTVFIFQNTMMNKSNFETLTRKQIVKLEK